MNFTNWVREGTAHPRAAIYLKVVAVLMLLSALSHLGSIMGIRGSWVDKPWHFRIADILLLAVSLVLTWGLWRTRLWAVVGWVAVVVFLQAVPILLFTEFFAASPRERAMLYGQLALNAALLGAFFALLPRKKRS